MVKICRFNPSQQAFTCSKLTIETLEQGCRSGVFIVNFEHISHLVCTFNLRPMSTGENIQKRETGQAELRVTLKRGLESL